MYKYSMIVPWSENYNCYIVSVPDLRGRKCTSNYCGMDRNSENVGERNP